MYGHVKNFFDFFAQKQRSKFKDSKCTALLKNKQLRGITPFAKTFRMKSVIT